MVTVRVKDWTKKKLDEIRDKESHSSLDSVIKTLLKDRAYAQSVRENRMEGHSSVETDETQRSEKPFDDLTVLAELTNLSDGVVFLWCPNCAKEIVHIGFEGAVSVSDFEIECQRCLSWLDEDVIVAIEISYPIENRLVKGVVEDELKQCVIDYWHRSLASAKGGRHDARGRDVEDLLEKYVEFHDRFEWDWPADTPVIDLKSGETYRNLSTGKRIDVLERYSSAPNEPDTYQIKRYTDTDLSAETEILNHDEVTNSLVSRDLVRDQTHSGQHEIDKVS